MKRIPRKEQGISLTEMCQRRKNKAKRFSFIHSFIHAFPRFMNTFCTPVAVLGAPDKEVIQGMVLELVLSVSNQGRWLDKEY